MKLSLRSLRSVRSLVVVGGGVAALAALAATFAVSIRGSAAHLDEARKALDVAGRLLGDLA